MIFGPLGDVEGAGSVKMASGTVESVNEIEVGFKPYAIWFSYLKATTSGASLNGNQVLIRPEDSDSYTVSYRDGLETIRITITFTDTGISVSGNGLNLPFFEDYTYYWFAIGCSQKTDLIINICISIIFTLERGENYGFN